MFFFRVRHRKSLKRFREIAESDAFSYDEVGATVEERLPAGYNVDQNRVGTRAFEQACAVLLSWGMFDLGWVELLHSSSTAEAGQTVLILARAWNLYSLSACRVIAMIDSDDGQVWRRGFSYGTLQHHVERGEERFTVEYHRQDESVWYDILAFSQPQHPLARIGYPLSRRAQRKFARDSKSVMRRAIS